jgi:hypothetical protein
LRVRLKEVLTVDRLVSAFSASKEFRFLGRLDKRRLLSILAPEFRIAKYEVRGMSVPLPSGGSVTNHTAAAYLVATLPLYLPINIDLRP